MTVSFSFSTLFKENNKTPMSLVFSKKKTQRKEIEMNIAKVKVDMWIIKTINLPHDMQCWYDQVLLSSELQNFHTVLFASHVHVSYNNHLHLCAKKSTTNSIISRAFHCTISTHYHMHLNPIVFKLTISTPNTQTVLYLNRLDLAFHTHPKMSF